MDNQQLVDVSTGATAAVTSGLAGAAGASLSSWKKQVKVGEMLFYVAFSFVLASTLPFAALALGYAWYVAIPAGFVAGVTCFGVVAWFDRFERKVPDLTLQELRDQLAGRSAPPPPPVVSQPSPEVKQ